jgi:hypothetical protein
MIDIRIPRKELNWDFVHKLDGICTELGLQACVTTVDIIPVPIEQVGIKGELVVGEENDG